MPAQDLIKQLEAYKNPAKAADFYRFFKTGKGEYGEGDRFLGVVVPKTRALAKAAYKTTPLKEVQTLLKNQYHEARLCGLLILTLKFEKAKEPEQKEIYDFYMANLRRGNNWDLVDCAAYKIAGRYLYGKDHGVLYKLAKSANLWEQRASMISTMYFVQRNDFETALTLAEYFLPHKHDLMHKAAGWILRVIGDKDKNTLYAFLDKHYTAMPRTMLRYAIEKLPPAKKAHYMKKA